MSKSKCVCGFVATCALAFGQAGAAPEKPASVKGVVVNAVTGAPVLRAHVVLRFIGSGTAKNFGALTNVEGKFAIDGVDAGQYFVALDKVGYVTTTSIPGFKLAAGEKKEDLEWKLVPTGAITGRVVGKDGEPIENVPVLAIAGANRTAAYASTDEKGEFRLGGLTPGKYRVRASPQPTRMPPEIRTDGTEEVHYSSSYYPGVLEFAGAARVEAHAGTDTGGTDIRMVRTPVVSIRGTVAGVPPGGHARIQFRDAHSVFDVAQARPDGSFLVWDPEPGKFEMFAVDTQPSGATLRSLPMHIELAGQSIDRVQLTLMGPVDLAGRVNYDDEQARPKQVGQQPVRRSVMLTPADGGMPKMVDLTGDESFTVTALDPARYTVTPLWGLVYVKAIRIGPNTVEGSTFDASQGGGAITIVVSSAMAGLSGAVNGAGGPAGHAIVALFPDSHVSARGIMSVETKADGTYSYTRLTPGGYYIVAVDEADRALISHGELDPDDLPGIEHIVLRGGDQATQDLKIAEP